MAKIPQRDRAVLHPYMSYKTFRGFLDTLRAKIPSRLDSSIVPSMNGSNRSLLFSTLRYFKLMTARNIPTEDLARLVTAGSEEVRQQVWLRLVKTAYAGVLANLDLERSTTKELIEAFQRGRSSETMRKSVTFFCAAVRDAGIEISPYIKPYAGRNGKRSSKESSQEGPNHNRQHKKSRVIDPHIPNLPEFDVSWPETIKEKWFEAYNQLLTKT